MRPHLALLDAAMNEIKPSVLRLREAGWPAEVVVYRDSPVEGEGAFGVKVVIRLDYVPVPIEASEQGRDSKGDCTHGNRTWDNDLLLSNPPRRRWRCPDCGATGTVTHSKGECSGDLHWHNEDCPDD